MSDNIPFDIQAEIIKNLPVKSLIRFRLVSKQWKSLIHSSKFIADQYQTHQKHRHHLLVCYSYKHVSIVDDDTFPQHKCSPTVPTSLYRLDIVSSQGLLFMHRDDICSGTEKALIWNPTIRKTVDIDLCCAQKRADYNTYFGFGVCPDTCDPKIVKVTNYQNSNKLDPICEVFTLSTNSWRRLSKNLPRECIFFTPNQVAIDRFMYWMANEEIYVDGYQSWYHQKLVVSFDMTSEEFTEISLPTSFAVVCKGSNSKIYNIRESLFVAHFEKEAGKRVHSVWKMMEHGASKSFTKLYTINTRDVVKRVDGFRKSGEPIVEMENGDRKDLFAYEPDSKQINYIGISGYGNFSVISYIETLLLLDH